MDQEYQENDRGSDFAAWRNLATQRLGEMEKLSSQLTQGRTVDGHLRRILDAQGDEPTVAAAERLRARLARSVELPEDWREQIHVAFPRPYGAAALCQLIERWLAPTQPTDTPQRTPDA